MVRIKYCVVVSVLCICTQVLYAQSDNIKKDITEAFQNADTLALTRAMNGLYELKYESPDEPGLYVIDTLAVLDILSHLESITGNITYTSDPNSRIAADMLNSMYYSSIGKFDSAILASKQIIDYLEKTRGFDKNLYCSILYLLSGYYYGVQDYESSLLCARNILKYVKASDMLFYDTSFHIAISELELGNLKSAYKYIRIAYNHPEAEYQSYRAAINDAYVMILQSLASTAILKNNPKRFYEYYEELLSIYINYPDINISSIETDFIIETISTMLTSGYEKPEIYENIDLLAQLSYKSFVDYNLFNYELTDGIAEIIRFWGVSALNADKPQIARLFFDYAYEMSGRVDLSDDILTYICDWYAYYYQYMDNNHILALNAYIRSLDNALMNNDKSTVVEYLKHILNVYDETISHVRYFNAKPKLENRIFLLSFSDTEYILKQWALISEKVIAQFGENFFNNVIKSYRDIPKDQRVFPFYSAEDNKLMQAHNLIKEANYTVAFKLINELVEDESLNDDELIDLIWRIDNNLYLNTGYKESDLFLQNICETSFVRNRSEITEWIDRERERIKNWLGYKLGYAHNLVEEGKVDDAMKEYDNILLQIPYFNNPDSLYLEVQMTRAIDLFYGSKYNDALLVSKEINELATNNVIDNYHTKINSLSIIVKSLIKLEHYTEAYSYCEENINLLKKLIKIDTSDQFYMYRLIAGLLDYGEINLSLKNYDIAEQAYFECLSKYSYSLDESHYMLAMNSLAEIYSKKLDESLKNRDAKLCLELYDKVTNLFKSHPYAEYGFISYFSPLEERFKETLMIIPREQVVTLCDEIIELDLFINPAKGSEIHPLEWHATVIETAASSLLELHYFHESIIFYDKAIEFVNKNNQYAWGGNINIMNLYTGRANAKQRDNKWVSSIEDRILAFKTSLNISDSITNDIKESFVDLCISIDIALATKVHYAIAILEDADHPHLKYEDCLTILQLWRQCLDEILGNYGEEYLCSLQNYLLRSMSYHEMQSLVEDRVMLFSKIDYIKCCLDINENRLKDFTQSFKKLWENVEPFDKADSIRKLRYDIVMDITSNLSHAGYTEWCYKVLEDYGLYLLSDKNNDIELAEKNLTELANIAWRMGDISRLNHYTRVVNSFDINNDPAIFSGYYDVNELIEQLILLSRLQENIDSSKALNTLYYAKKLVENNTKLLNNESVTNEVASTLYNDIAASVEDSKTSIEFYKKSLDISPIFNYVTMLNLANRYSSIGEYSQADSLLSIVYEYSKQNFMEPTWKNYMYKCLTYNSIKRGDYNKALEHSRERLHIQESDYLQMSQSLTSSGRNNYWDNHYTSTLSDASTTDLACGSNGSNSYNAALFQKSILIRQKSSIKNNIINCNDTELIQAFDRYNQEIRSHSDSATSTEEYCMYLYSLHPEFVSSFSVPRWQEIQASLNKKDLALEFTEAFDEVNNEYYYAAILLRKGYKYPIIVKLCKKNDLLSLHYNKVDNSGFSISIFEDQSALYQLIWEPLEKYLKGVKTIYYSPYEFLNNINMEAAKKKEGAKPIGFAHNMVRVSTTAELLSDQYTSFSNAAVFGDIDYDAPFNQALIAEVDAYRSTEDNYTALRGSKHEAWERLVHAAREVEGINHLLRNNDIIATNFTNDQGTEEAFKSLSSNAPDILHLATHGFYYTSEEAQEHEYFRMSDKLYYDSGVRSGIILTSGNHAWRGKSVPYGVEDGILTANEISGIDLSNTDLITLSACQTALGDIASDGVYGMQRSFKVAGVKTIIMSLWQVDDEATYLMMEKFYDELTKGKGKREAFQDAQLYIKDWAEKRVKELKDTFSDKIPEIQEKKKAEYGRLLYPEYYWAAFIMLD